MLKILFLVLMSSVAFAQTGEKPKAVKFDEFGVATNGYVKMKMDSFYVELGNNPSAEGIIINYGTDNELAVREKQIQNAINFRKFDASRITIVRGGLRKTVSTELWIAPPGAEKPEPKSNARQIDEFGKITDEEFKARLDALYIELGNNLNSQGFILNYGSAKEILARETGIKKYIALRKLDLSKVTFKKAGVSKAIKTEIWIFSPDEETK